MQKLLRSSLAVVILLSSSAALALFDAQVQVGMRSGTWKAGSTSDSISSSSAKVSAHLDPIPLVPVSFGVAVGTDTWKVSKDKQNLKDLSSYHLTPEITAWLPLGDLKPYARVGYSILSAYKGTVAIDVAGTEYSTSAGLTGSGPRAAVGVDWSILPLLSITAEYEYSNETLSWKSVSVGPLSTDDFEKPTLTSTAIMVGAKLKI